MIDLIGKCVSFLLEQKAEYTEELNQRGIKVKDNDKAQDLKAKLQSELKGISFDKLWNFTNNKHH